MGGGECRSNDYGAATYWDARYSSPSSTGGSGGGRGGEFFDWYQTYPALRPLLRARLPTSSRMLMLGCGNSLLSEDMVKDGYEEVVNIDISSVVIEQMREKHMDVRDMSFFGDETFDCVLDKGTLDAMMITYGAPKERVPLLYQAGCDRKIKLYIMPTPGYQLKRSNGAPLTETIMEEVALTEEGQLPPDYVLKDPESHFIYVCQKSDAANGAPVKSCSQSHNGMHMKTNQISVD
uniref:Methyltransferase type 11 domain-containing protein n=1 Tax=Leersia perrieri TaxID=77586 RepID=A0A0D9WG56_9ORYZ